MIVVKEIHPESQTLALLAIGEPEHDTQRLPDVINHIAALAVGAEKPASLERKRLVAAQLTEIDIIIDGKSLFTDASLHASPVRATAITAVEQHIEDDPSYSYDGADDMRVLDSLRYPDDFDLLTHNNLIADGNFKPIINEIEDNFKGVISGRNDPIYIEAQRHDPPLTHSAIQLRLEVPEGFKAGVNDISELWDTALGRLDQNGDFELVTVVPQQSLVRDQTT